MAELKKISVDFQKEIGIYDDTVLVINITWIGHTLYFDKNNFHTGLKKDIGIGTPKESADGSRHSEWYAITHSTDEDENN